MLRLLLVAALASITTSADAAKITLDRYLFGGWRMTYRGEVTDGDDREFQSMTTPPFPERSPLRPKAWPHLRPGGSR